MHQNGESLNQDPIENIKRTKIVPEIRPAISLQLSIFSQKNIKNHSPFHRWKKSTDEKWAGPVLEA
jgi:hypothetical protein